MVELIAKSPAAGLLPITHGAFRLEELPVEKITSVSPLDGAQTKVSTALERAIGAGLPATGRSVEAVKGEVIWTGQSQYFVIGREVPVLDAAITDQSDAWTCAALRGEGSVEVMARLCPLDARSMADGDVARSLIGHMAAIIIARADGFDLMVFRSMAQTLVHEVEQIMKSLTAQAKL